MNLFRSEEHVQRWLNGRKPGATIPVETLWNLAHAWYRDRLAPDWRPRDPEENHAILRSLGLTGALWGVEP